MTNQQIALAAVRQCTAKQYAAFVERYATDVLALNQRYLSDMTAIGSADLQAVRTMRHDRDMAKLEARYGAAREKVAEAALKRAIAALDTKMTS